MTCSMALGNTCFLKNICNKNSHNVSFKAFLCLVFLCRPFMSRRSIWGFPPCWTQRTWWLWASQTGSAFSLMSLSTTTTSMAALLVGYCYVYTFTDTLLTAKYGFDPGVGFPSNSFAYFKRFCENSAKRNVGLCTFPFEVLCELKMGGDVNSCGFKTWGCQANFNGNS